MAKRALTFNDPCDTSSNKKTMHKKKKISSPISPSEIHSPDNHVTVQALVASVSPVKPSKYFDGEVTDGDTMIRFVGFDKEQLHSWYTKRIPVTIKDCQNKFNNQLEIVIKSCKTIEQCDAEFFVENIKTIGSTLIDIGQLSTMKEYDCVTVKVTVL